MGDLLKKAIEKARKEHELYIGNMSGLPEDVAVISTGNLAIDLVTGVRGLPRGRIVELYGPPSCGKTTTALQTAAQAQAMGLTVAYFDYECALDRSYCRDLGIDIESDRWVFLQPSSFEQGVNISRDFVKTGEVGVIIFDSIAAMVPEIELGMDTGSDSNFGKQAKLMAQTLRQLTAVLHNTKTLAIFLNHIRDVVDITPMGKKLASAGVQRKTTPGGHALKFYSSVRMEYKSIGGVRDTIYDIVTNEEKDVVAGQKVQVTCVKNKVAPPFGECEVLVRFGKGFSDAAAVIDIAANHGLIKEEKGGVYRFAGPEWEDFRKINADKDWVRGRLNIVEFLEEHPDAKDLIKTKVLAKLAS